MNTFIALALIVLGCGAGTFLALAILAMASMGDDDEA